MKNLIYLSIFVVAMISITGFASHNAYAASSYELQVGDTNHNCGAIGGTFSSNTCTVATSFTLNSGDFLKIDSGVTLSITGSIQNSGNISNLGSITYNTITNNNGGNFNNNGTVTTNTFFSNFYNNGTVNNNGPSGIIKGTRGSVFYNFNAGTINNSGTMTDVKSDSVTVYNYHIINNNSGGKITNYFHFVNEPGATINNNIQATINNNFIFYQQGTVTNNGTFSNHGDVTGYCGATFNNVNIYIGKFPDTPTGC